jgi:exodeoxyribonuclease VII large subunit
MLARQRLTALSISQMQNRLQALIGRRAQRLDDLRNRIEAAANRLLRARANRLTVLATRIQSQNPAVRLALARRRLEAAAQSLRRLARSTIADRASRLDRARASLDALSPLAVLNRGYALVYLENAAAGQLLRNASDAHPGQTIRARLAQGSVSAEVKSTNSA